MIQSGSYLSIMDNSGAKDVCCIKVLNGFKKRYARVGDIIVVSIKSLRVKNRFTSKIKQGSVSKAIILHVRKGEYLKSHEIYNSSENSAVLISKQNKPVGSRVFGGVPRSVLGTKFKRIASSSNGILNN